MTKRLTFLFGGWLVWVLFTAFPVYADGGPHHGYGGTGTPGTSCASCHRAHTAVAPDLLTSAQPALCYACHGDTGTGAATDVQGGLDQTATDPTKTALRGGGFQYTLIDSAAADASGWASTPTAALAGGGKIAVLTAATRKASTSWHTVDGTAATMWGNGAIGSGAGPTVSLYCASCHDPHGNGQYRILRPIPNSSNAASPGIIIPDVTTKVYTTANYWNINGNETSTSTFDSQITAWCSTCHTRYMAGLTDSQISSTDPIFAYRHYTASGAGSGVAYSPVCLQCHVAHGTDATEARSAATVPLPGQTGTITSNANDSRLLRLESRGVCQMCHLR
jgi:predicted CXXCH cytochrome family protein